MRRLLFIAILLFSVRVFAADKLRWGADMQSGAPFGYKSPDDPTKIIGFEAEIATALAGEMGMEVQFVQNTWEGLIQGLNRGDYDIVMNGLEITPDREQEVKFSQPYYVTSEALGVRKENTTITTLESLKGLRVGTMEGAVAQRILNEQKFPITVVPYMEEVHAYGDLALGRLDATLFDEPIALYYGAPNPDLKLVGAPIGEISYGIATRMNDKAFGKRIEVALEKLIQSGKIREILERWNLWNKKTADAWRMDSRPLGKPVMYQQYLSTAWHQRTFKDKLIKYASFLPLLAKGAVMTLEISVLSMVLAMAIGLMVALGRLYGPSPVRWLSVSFVEVWRGTPLLIQLYLIFYGLPKVGIRLDPYFAAVIGLGMNYGAAEAENYRAGILSIPKSQMEASQALGMSFGQSLRHIILPQAIRVVIPPVTNDFIALLKDSSLVSVISMVELTTTYGQLASTYFDYLGIGILTAAIYFLIGLPFVRLSRYFEEELRNEGEKKKSRLRGIARGFRKAPAEIEV